VYREAKEPLARRASCPSSWAEKAQGTQDGYTGSEKPKLDQTHPLPLFMFPITGGVI